MLRIATSPIEERPWHTAKPNLFARGSPIRGAKERKIKIFKKALDNTARLRYNNHAVFETAGAGTQRKAKPPAEKRA